MTTATTQTMPLLTALDLVVYALRENDTTEDMDDLSVLAWFSEQYEADPEFATAGIEGQADSDLLKQAVQTVARAFGLRQPHPEFDLPGFNQPQTDNTPRTIDSV